MTEFMCVDKNLQLTDSDEICLLFGAAPGTADLRSLLIASYQLDALPWLDAIQSMGQGPHQARLRVLPVNQGIRSLVVTASRVPETSNLQITVEEWDSVNDVSVRDEPTRAQLFEAIYNHDSALIVYEVDSGLLMTVNPRAESLLGLSCLDLRESKDLVLWRDMAERAAWVREFGNSSIVDDFPITWITANRDSIPLKVAARHLDFTGLHACLMHLTPEDEPLGQVFEMTPLAETINPFLGSDFIAGSDAASEATLDSGDSRFSAIFNASPMPILVTHGSSADAGTGSQIVEANTSAVELFGWPVYELAHMSTSQLFESEEEFYRIMREQAIAGTVNNVETCVVTRAGIAIPVSVYSRIFRVDDMTHGLWQFVDLRQQKAIEEELRSALDRLQQAQRIGQIGDFRWNASTKEIWASDQANQIMGNLKTSERRFIDLPQVLGLDKNDFQTFLDSSLVQGNNEFNYQFIQEVSDRETHVSIRGLVESNAEGVWLIGTVQDITDTQLAERQRRDMESKVQESQRLESLGVLAGGVAHDFNNLLVGITGNADLALLEQELPENARSRIEDVMRAGLQASDLTRQLLAYSGKGRFVVEKADLNEVVSEISRLLEVSTSKNSVLHFDFATDLPAIECDVTQMRQVIMNLIINASESIVGTQGLVTVSTGFQHCTSEYLHSTHITGEIPEGDYVFFEVTDNGSGMDADTLRKIFEPFFTTKFSGRGLGLAAVLGIIKGHSGTLKIYSEPGRGTSMKVLLPAAAGEASKRSSNTFEDDWEGHGSILVIDDEPFVSKFVEKALSPRGFKVIAAANGRLGPEMFRQHAHEITVVILDLTMPNMNGEQCFWELRQINPDVKVVLTSGYNEQEATSKFVGKGLSGFVAKPFMIKDLLRAVRQAIG